MLLQDYGCFSYDSRGDIVLCALYFVVESRKNIKKLPRFCYQFPGTVRQTLFSGVVDWPSCPTDMTSGYRWAVSGIHCTRTAGSDDINYRHHDAMIRYMNMHN